MKKTIEVPDLEIHPIKHPSDVMEIFVRKNELVFRVGMDGTGNEFVINRYDLLKLIHILNRIKNKKVMEIK